METTERTKLLNALYQGIVTVTFKKIGTGEIRVMPCTLNSDILVENGIEIKLSMNVESEHYACYAIDKKAWRSFRLDTVQEWVVSDE